MTDTKPLTISESLVLDVVRIGAAVVVALGHLTVGCFSTGWPRLMPFGEAAVAVFFVLSGFVIRHVTCRRPATLRHYLGDRASRIYSVALPALAVTLVVAAVAQLVNPGFYATFAVYSTQPFDRLLENTVFTAQCWTREVVPFCNSPFWSLNYEVVYYILYGCAFYLKGWTRISWIVLVAFAAGPKILLLFPLWLMGCLAHDLYQAWVASGKAKSMLNASITALLAIFSVSAVLAFAVHGLAHRAMDARMRFILESEHLKLGMTSGATILYPVAIVGVVLLMRVLLAVRDLNIETGTYSVRVLRFIAEGTFPIYLLDFPLFVLIAACVPYNHGSSLHKILILASVLTIGILAGHPLNTFKRWLRALSFLGFVSRQPA